MTSVLFADLVGFTPLSESRDAEEVRELLTQYFARCREVIARYGGVVEKFIGDAVMAVWGVPVAREDDAERAVRAGLDLAAMVAALGEELEAPLALRVGIVAGEVAVTVGATAEGMVAGDAVNTAARVQTAAEPGHVWVNDNVRALAAGAIAFTDTGSHALKGKAEPMRLWQAESVVGEPGEREPRDGLRAPFVGRDAELGVLTAHFHGVERTGLPRLVVVDGEGGIGKSRLLSEFEAYADSLTSTVRWHRGRCLAYGEGVAFWALAEAVRARLGLVGHQSADDVSTGLDAGLAQYVAEPGDREWLRPRLAVLLGISDGPSFPRDDLFAAWAAFLEHVAHGSDALVLVVDDAHHADDGLLDFVDHLLANAHSPIFVIALARPELLERRADLGGRRTTVLSLAPLSDAQMQDLVDGLVPGLPEPTRDAIVERSDGVPLFAIETVRALVDQGLLVWSGGRVEPAPGARIDLAALGAPVTLHALVAARLDALTPAERRVVADASVLGKTFDVDALLALGSHLNDLQPVLDALQRKEILAVQTDRFSAERGQYRFVQSVVRQVAYATQSRRDRKARHLRAADHLAGLDDHADDLAVVIAQHLIDAIESALSRDDDVAELTARASGSLERAGTRARSLGSPSDAERLFASALERSTAPVAQARLNLAVAQAANEAAHYDVARVHGGQAASMSEALGDPVQAGCAVAEEVVALVSTGDNAGALAVGRPTWERLLAVEGAEPALNLLARNLASASLSIGDMEAQGYYVEHRLRIARALDDKRALASASIQLGVHYMHEGEPDKARAMMEQGARIAREHDIPDSLAYALLALGSSTKSRDLHASLAYAEEACVVARRTGRPLYLDYAMGNLVQSLWSSGRLVDARERLTELAERATEPSVRMSLPVLDGWLSDADGREPAGYAEDRTTDSEGVLAWIRSAHVLAALRDGDLPTASRLAEEAVGHVIESMGLDDDFVMMWPPLVHAAIAAGDVDRAQRLLEPVANARQESVAPGVHAHWHVLRGLVAALSGAADPDVESDLRSGVEALERYGAVGDAARATEELGRWLHQRGRPDEGAEMTRRARATYEDIGAFGWLARMDARQRERPVAQRLAPPSQNGGATGMRASGDRTSPNRPSSSAQDA